MSVSTRVDIIEPKTLQSELAAERDNLLLVQITTPQVFEQAHIEGAVLVTPGELICGIPPATGKLPHIDALNALFTRIGYHSGLDIVIYDDEGGGWAGRFAWTLDIIGHDGWRYLNGGLHAWHHDGQPLTQGHGHTVTPSQVSLTIDTTPIAEIPDVLASLDDPNQVVWDVRSAEEFAGIRQASARSGHIPGAINLDWLLLQDPPRQYRLAAGIEDTLVELGIADKANIITHCQTHHRSGLSYMCGRLFGLPIKAYHGSWSEWGNDPDTPIELPA